MPTRAGGSSALFDVSIQRVVQTTHC